MEFGEAIFFSASDKPIPQLPMNLYRRAQIRPGQFPIAEVV
jgi:hypothetical protein